MPSPKNREIALLCIPTLFLVGAFWWVRQPPPPISSSAPVLPPKPKKPVVSSAPLRIRYTKFQVVPVTPFDFSQGFSWKAKTSLQISGAWNAPPGLVKTGRATGGTTVWGSSSKDGPDRIKLERQISFDRESQDINEVRFSSHVYYRRGKVWRMAQIERESSITRHIPMLPGELGDESMIKLNLAKVPKKAEEVRLKGTFRLVETYKGTLPPGWKEPRNFTSHGSLHQLTFFSPPFDVVIKGKGQPLPAPIISHAPQIQVVEAKWLVSNPPQPSATPSVQKTPSVQSSFKPKNAGGPKARTKYLSFHYPWPPRNEFVLHLRNQRDPAWAKRPRLRFEHLRVFDAKNSEVPLRNALFPSLKFEKSLILPMPLDKNRFDSQAPDSDVYFSLFFPNIVPPKPWESYAQPLRFEAEITDEECWPVKIVALFRSEKAAPTPTPPSTETVKTTTP